jgi:hypothetical protein
MAENGATTARPTETIENAEHRAPAEAGQRSAVLLVRRGNSTMTQDSFGGDERDASFQTLADVAYGLDGGAMPILEALDHAVGAFPVPDTTNAFEFYAVARFVQMLRDQLRVKLYAELDEATKAEMLAERLPAIEKQPIAPDEAIPF